MDEFEKDFRDLIGDPGKGTIGKIVRDEEERVRAREKARAERARARGTLTPSAAADERDALIAPHNISTLAKIFAVKRDTAVTRLASVPPESYSAFGTPLYTIRTAAPHILRISKEIDLPSVLENMKPKDLPQQLQKAFWDAKLARQKYEIRAAELWYSEDVIDVLGEAFKTIKNQMQLWVDNLEGSTEFSVPHRQAMTQMVDALAQDLHDALVKMPSLRKTPSAFARDMEAEEAE